MKTEINTSNTKITFKLIDGKPVPHVWTMPEKSKYRFDKRMDESGVLGKDLYQQDIICARENAVPIKEEFIDDLVWDIFEREVKGKMEGSNWTPDLTRDYDVDMEFEVEIEDCLIKVQTGFHCGLTDKCNQGCEKVAILKTEEVKQLSDYRTVTDKVQVEPVKEQKEQVKLSNKIDDVLQSYLPDDYYKEIRKKLIPKIVKLFKNLNQPTESGEGNTDEHLLPCPFCGSKPEWVHKVHPSGIPGLRCPECQFIMKDDRFDKTIWLWNRRIKQLESVAPTDESNRYFKKIIEVIDATIFIYEQGAALRAINALCHEALSSKLS